MGPSEKQAGPFGTASLFSDPARQAGMYDTGRVAQNQRVRLCPSGAQQKRWKILNQNLI